MSSGWIKIHRSLLEKGWANDNDYFKVWVTLLMQCTHKPKEYFWNGQTIVLQPGQYITTRNRLSLETNVSAPKIQRILKTFEIEQQIEQQTSNTSRLISIVNWSKYQLDEQQTEQRANNGRTTSEQRVNTKQEREEGKKEKNVRRFKPPTPLECLEYLEVNFCDALERRIIEKIPQDFIDYYESKNWMVGKNKMSNWKSALNGWTRRRVEDQEKKQSNDKIGRNTKADIREAMRTDNF